MLWPQHPTGEGVQWLLPEALVSEGGERHRVIECAPCGVDSSAAALRGHPHRSTEYLGVSDLPPRTAPVDLGYDYFTVEGHLERFDIRTLGRVLAFMNIALAGRDGLR